MNGKIDLTLMDASNYKDDDFAVAIKEGRINGMLDSLNVHSEFKNNNLVFDNYPGFLFSALFSGPGVSFPFSNDPASNGALASMNLTTEDSEPTYQESQTFSFFTRHIHNVGDAANGATGGKRFIEDDIVDPDIIVDSTGREAVLVRSKFLYLPGEGVSNDIKSVAVWFRTDADRPGTDTFGEWGKTARVRLKDSGGTPTTINKTASQVLLIEYTFTVVSI